MRLEGATDLEAGAGALAKGCPALRDCFSRAPRLSADALEPLFGLGRPESCVSDLPNVDARSRTSTSSPRTAGCRCGASSSRGRGTAAKVAQVEAALAERSTTVEIALRDTAVAEEAPK